MNNFRKLRELQNDLKSKGYKSGDQMSKSDYVKSVNKVFGLKGTVKDVPWS